MPEVIPTGAPVPVAVLGWDGTNFRVIRVHTSHRLIVRGENQLHSFGGVLAEERTAVISGANGYVDSVACPAGQILHVTTICARDQTNNTTGTRYFMMHNAALRAIGDTRVAVVANEYECLYGHWWLDVNDYFRIYFDGALAGDTCRVTYTGELFTLEV